MKKILTFGIMLLLILMTVSSASEVYLEKQSIKPSSELIIDGPTLVKVGVQYYYNIYLTEPEDDILFIRLNLGDGEWTEWLGPYESDEKFVWRILWPASGIYTIQAEAKCNDSTYYASLIVRVVDGNILYVGGNGPGNYSNIQDAIDNASIGDTVFVFNGTYGLLHHSIIINKSINLIGENKVNTIINGSDVRVIASEVLICGFTIQNSSGIGTWYSDNLTIMDNIFKQNNYGGIIIYYSNNNTITNNSFFNCGLVLWGYHNLVHNNTVNNKPLMYLESTSEKVIEYAGQVILINCDNITINNIELSAIEIGIQIYECTNCYVIRNILSNISGTGIYLGNSTDNTISGNTFINNYFGLHLVFAEHNNISENHFENKMMNIGLINSYNNLFSKNNFKFNYSPKLKSIISIESDNKWKSNYWNESRKLPVFLWGIKTIKLFRERFGISLDIDWCPALEPYDIEG